jgi:hypothetical protein
VVRHRTNCFKTAAGKTVTGTISSHTAKAAW